MSTVNFMGRDSLVCNWTIYQSSTAKQDLTVHLAFGKAVLQNDYENSKHTHL